MRFIEFVESVRVIVGGDRADCGVECTLNDPTFDPQFSHRLMWTVHVGMLKFQHGEPATLLEMLRLHYTVPVTDARAALEQV